MLRFRSQGVVELILAPSAYQRYIRHYNPQFNGASERHATIALLESVTYPYMFEIGHKRGKAARPKLDGGVTREPQNTFTTPVAARYVGVSAATLRFWRANDEGPRWFHAGERLVRYRRADLDEWIESRLSR